MVLQTKNDPAAFRRIVELKADMANLDHGDVFLKIEREMSGKAAPAAPTAN
jgi:hypothetical protein